MLKKGTKLYSILKKKCPVCHEGDFFISRTYDIKNSGKIYEKCPNCGEVYSKEPGFYQGAMYVSYALGVAMFIAVFILTYLFYPEPSTFTYIVILLITMLLLAPYLYELSKIIWANLFMSYKKQQK